MASTQLVVTTQTADATQALGEATARLLDGPAVLALSGDLGAGKTTFTQGLGRGLGVASAITSPTFVLINRYRCADGRFLQHADCYRLANAPLEMWDAGLEDLMWGEDVVVVEWSDRVPGLLPDEHLEVHFVYLDDERRSLRFSGQGPAYISAIATLADQVAAIAGAHPEALRQQE